MLRLFTRTQPLIEWQGVLMTIHQANAKIAKRQHDAHWARKREEFHQQRADECGQSATQAEKDYMDLEDLVSAALDAEAGRPA